jgi:tetratricopeptide (TPR) repeat protein
MFVGYAVLCLCSTGFYQAAIFPVPVSLANRIFVIIIKATYFLGEIMKKKIIMGIMFQFTLTAVLFAEAPAWFISLRDAVFEQKLSGSEILPIYVAAKDHTEGIFSEVDKYIMHARCENLMGQIYQWEGDNTQAGNYYKRGESFANSAIDIQPTSEGYYVLAESIALLCNVKGLGYQMANGMRFMTIANMAISRDPHNAAAKYLLAAMYAFPDPPFRNLRIARQRLEKIIDNDNEYMSPDIRFNVYYALGFVNQKQNRLVDARYWFHKASALYPTNKDVQNRLGEI